MQDIKKFVHEQWTVTIFCERIGAGHHVPLYVAMAIATYSDAHSPHPDAALPGSQVIHCAGVLFPTIAQAQEYIWNETKRRLANLSEEMDGEHCL